MIFDLESTCLKALGVSLVISVSSCVGGSKQEKTVSNGENNTIAVAADEGKSETVVTTVNDSAKSVEGMVFFSGGKIRLGAHTGRPIEQPVFEKEISPFYLDKHPVSVKQFKKFVSATGYRTEAESYGNSAVFQLEVGQWQLLDGAYWKMPLGPKGNEADDNHPVTHVSWNDAVAYAQWAGKRLPSEFEWEYAARNGKNDGWKFPWGNEMVVDGQYKANVWQGETAQDPEVKDGFMYTSPIGAFGETPVGLTDMSGNVWQWTASLMKPYPGATQGTRAGPEIRVIRGGSFFFDQAGEQSNTVWFRAQNTVETSLFNTGFRCAKSFE